MHRRQFLKLAALGAAGVVIPGVSGCSGPPEPGRYTAADVEGLARQRTEEAAAAGHGPYGRHVYRGYRGLAELPWFELDDAGQLRCVADDFPPAIDFHCHLGMSMLFAPDVDLLASTPRVEHLLDCDATDPGCELDLDVYINGNFDDEALCHLQYETIVQALWGSSAAATQTIPNLLREMDATRVEQSVILPIAFNFPFGDDLAERWHAAVKTAGQGRRLHVGASVHPRDPDRLAKLERQAADGARVVKLHPTVQRFYPDDDSMMELYEACQRLGMIVFFHAGRAGVEPESSHRYAVPRHYERPIREFPGLPFVLGHAGARDGEGMLEMGARYENAWFGIHGQGLTRLGEILQRTGGERMLFGTDWPWYHLGATLAKVLIVTEGKPEMRAKILRGNAESLLASRA
jgi:predicted TIM-barrel fold metal-dependent hydrolase